MTWYIGWIIKTIRRMTAIFRYSAIMAGNISVGVLGGLYFRKPLSETESVKDSEIFSDNESRIDMIDHVIKTRLLPVLIIFLCCVLPNLLKSTEDNELFSAVFTVFFAVMTAIYSYVLIYCGLKLRKLRKKYTND